MNIGGDHPAGSEKVAKPEKELRRALATGPAGRFIYASLLRVIEYRLIVRKTK